MPNDRAPIVLTVNAAASSSADALELLRRVRLFADEMRSAGLYVTVDGSLTITVRPARSHKAKAAETAEDDDDGLAFLDRAEDVSHG